MNEHRIDFCLQKAASGLYPSTEAKADAEILLAYVLKKNRTHLLAWPEKQLNEDESNRFWHLIAQRAEGWPVAYLIGQQEFWSREFNVTPDVLIPRPETEQLIELALQKKPSKILELGTGSGAIAVTLALELPQSKITAIDFCQKALEIARHNAKRLHAENISFLQSDWFESIAPSNRFDLIVSNPPYIAKNDPHLKSLGFEPIHALRSGIEGLDDIEKIIQTAPNYLEKNGWLMLEHGFDQGMRIRSLLEKAGFKDIETLKDLQGHDRVSVGSRFKVQGSRGKGKGERGKGKGERGKGKKYNAVIEKRELNA